MTGLLSFSTGFQTHGFSAMSHYYGAAEQNLLRVISGLTTLTEKKLFAGRSLVVGSNPSNGKGRYIHFVRPLERLLKSRQPQRVATMPASLWWNHLSDHPLVQWCNGASM